MHAPTGGSGRLGFTGRGAWSHPRGWRGRRVQVAMLRRQRWPTGPISPLPGSDPARPLRAPPQFAANDQALISSVWLRPSPITKPRERCSGAVQTT